MTVRILILIISVTLLATVLLTKRYRPGLIEKIKSSTTSNSNSAIGYGAGLGVAFGAGIGAAIDDVGVGVALGMCIGTAIGAAINKRTSSQKTELEPKS